MKLTGLRSKRRRVAWHASRVSCHIESGLSLFRHTHTHTEAHRNVSEHFGRFHRYALSNKCPPSGSHAESAALISAALQLTRESVMPRARDRRSMIVRLARCDANRCDVRLLRNRKCHVTHKQRSNAAPTAFLASRVSQICLFRISYV